MMERVTLAATARIDAMLMAGVAAIMPDATDATRHRTAEPPATTWLFTVPDVEPAVVAVTITDRELLMNAGKEQAVNLVAQKVRNALRARQRGDFLVVAANG